MHTSGTLAIDLRWIDSSGVGVYIQGIMPGIIQQLTDVNIVGIGDRSRLEQFSWSSVPNFTAVDCRAERYSLLEQVQLPLAIPTKTDLFFSPYYTIPLLYRGRIAVTVHDMSHLIVDEIVQNAKKRTYARLMYAQLRKRACLIFTVSEFSKSELIRLTAEGPGTIIPTHLGVSDEWFEPNYPCPEITCPYLVCVGNVKPYKNLRRLVEAFLRVQDRIPHTLVIVGQSEGLITGESDSFFDLVRSGGNRISLTGYVSHQQLLSLVTHAAALVMPSLYEGFGLPPLEAMASGVPAVVSRAASLPEVCGDAALYFDPLSVDSIAEALIHICTSAELRERLVDKGHQRSSSFTWNKCATQTATALRSALMQNA